MTSRAFTLRRNPDPLGVDMQRLNRIWPKLQIETAHQGVGQISLFGVGDNARLSSEVADVDVRSLWA